MFEIQMNWRGSWITVQTGFGRREEAEWAVSQWRQDQRCYGDPFRIKEVSYGNVEPLEASEETPTARRFRQAVEHEQSKNRPTG